MSVELTHISHNSNGVDNAGFDDVVLDEVDKHKDVEHQDYHDSQQQESLDSDDDVAGNCCSRGVGSIQSALGKFYKKYSKIIWNLIGFIFLGAYIAYVGYAFYYRFGDEGSYRLLGATILGALVLLWGVAGRYISSLLKGCYGGCVNCTGQTRCFTLERLFRWFLYVAMFVFFVVYTALVIGRNHPRNLVSLGGMGAFILIMYITSISPAKVNWHPVFWGISIQYAFACIILETTWGYQAFQWLGDRMTEILNYSNAGAKFVFGNNYEEHMFAFKVLPVIIYFSSFISVLYYLGVMQSLIRVIGRFLSFCLETTPTESLNAAGNIFAGQTESPLMIRPFLPTMTKSEMHAVMTGGFATVSGSVLGAYVSYGVKANHLLSASVMSAPAALAISKLTYPETETSRTDPKDVYKLKMKSQNNIIEAASEGASVAIKLVANVAVNVMAFMALLELVNTSLHWFGDRVGVEDLSFQLICSYIFYPLSYLMGVETEDCRRVAKLLGYKTFMNEFVAYVEMGKLLDNGELLKNYTSMFPNSTTSFVGDGDIYLPEIDVTLIGGYLLPRSEVIATYALCGFSNLGSMGIQIGGLGAMAPTRRQDLIGMAMRAMIAGNVACFLTACVAGLFYSGDS